VDPDEQVAVEHEQLENAEYSGRKLMSFVSIGSRFTRCRFERMRVDHAALGAGMELSEYLDCSFDGSKLTLHSGGFTRFERCSFRNVELRSWDADHVELIDCVFTGRLRTARFWGSPLPSTAQDNYEEDLRFLAREGRPVPAGYRELALRSKNEIHGNDFSNAEFANVSFRRGVDLSSQRLPSGDDYLYLPDAAATIGRARLLLQQRAVDGVSARAERLLLGLTSDVDEGQRQLLLREKDFAPRGDKPHVALVFAVLRNAMT